MRVASCVVPARGPPSQRGMYERITSGSAPIARTCATRVSSGCRSSWSGPWLRSCRLPSIRTVVGWTGASGVMSLPAFHTTPLSSRSTGRIPWFTSTRTVLSGGDVGAGAAALAVAVVGVGEIGAQPASAWPGGNS